MVMVRSAAFVFLLAAPAAALQLAARVPAARPLTARAPHVRLEEKPPMPSEELSAEQIVATAEKASEPQEAWPESRPVPGLAPIVNDAGESKEFDPRFILYVSLPALVLGGQLFFTFSRDALGEMALGPAVMDLFIPY
jgi:hypothetical protein